DMITGTLGIKADTKKSEIGKYFSDIEKSMQTTKAKLNEILEKNGQYEKVKTVVEQFISGTVDKIAEGAKEAAKGATGGDAIGNAVKEGQDAVAADTTSVNLLVKGIRTIVGVVLKENEGDEKADKTIDSDKKKVGQLFAKKNDDRAQDTEAAKASASVGAVSGADILQAIAKSSEAVNVDEIDKAKNAAEIAIAPAKDDKKEVAVESAKKDAVIAAGIALRAMAKDGKFASKQNEEKSANAVNGAVSSSVNKVLSTLVIGIRNRVNEGLKEINKMLGEIKQGEGSVAKINE
uniref:variable large family protein n=1 Tax=Borrelia hispanica TaxID=40835 RepID=UPI0004640562